MSYVPKRESVTARERSYHPEKKELLHTERSYYRKVTQMIMHKHTSLYIMELKDHNPQ